MFVQQIYEYNNSINKVNLHPESLSPDPTYGRDIVCRGNNLAEMDIYPYQVIRVYPGCWKISKWSEEFSPFKHCPAMTVIPDAEGRFELIIDFGTELNGSLELNIDTNSSANLMIAFGESIPEAEGMLCPLHPKPQVFRYIPANGNYRFVYEQRGFRFIRLMLNDIRSQFTLNDIVVHAEFVFQTRIGDFKCSDSRFQRVWQTSVYTARLCSRPDTLWDGIKRDRIGWYGDARITKETIDNVFFDQSPSEKMLQMLPVNNWANGIPNYSFDAVAMLKQHILTYGLDNPCVKETFGLIKELFSWVRMTQTDESGFIKRTDAEYYNDTGFVDWSPMPLGGRFEELCWLQCKYVEALKDASIIAKWLKEDDEANNWIMEAYKLEREIIRKFWDDKNGFIHTLNLVKPVDDQYAPGGIYYYKDTYINNIKLGPSGPSRQSNALAVWAGVCTNEMKSAILQKVFNNRKIPPVITPYFAYYEQIARAECGDPTGAFLNMRDYIGGLLETEDAASIWEIYDPDMKDLRRFNINPDLNKEYTTSLCHGWGSGAVPLTTRYLLGITAESPGFKSISIKPSVDVPWAFQATVPTPEGTIRVLRNEKSKQVQYIVPEGIRVVAFDETKAVISTE